MAEPAGGSVHQTEAIEISERGVLTSSVPGVFIIHVPDRERQRVEHALVANRIAVHTRGKNRLAEGLYDFVAVVKCSDEARLRMIVFGDG